MIAEIAARHGVRLDPDDPAFLLVELNNMMIEDKETDLQKIIGSMDEPMARITGLIGLLQKAGDIYKETLTTYTNSTANTIKDQMENDVQAAKARFDRDAADAIRAALIEVRKTVQNEIAAPVQKALQAQQQSIWQMLALCLLCGLIGGLAVVGGNAWLHNKDDADFAALGKSVAASWDKLDSKAKAAINAERRP